MLKATPRTTWLAAMLFTALAATIRSHAADSSNASDPLLDLFIKKGFVTQQEAEQVETEAQTLRTNQMQMPPALPSKWKISDGLKKVELFGDIRLRYEDRSAEDAAGNQVDLQRLRYAVRVGLRGDLFDEFYYGFRLDTSANPRSSFVSLGTSASGGPYQGPFGKSNGGINIGLVYLGWRPEDWIDFTIGKMPNPLYTTPMVWNGNITPEGAAERLRYTVGRADFFATLGQFLYADFNPSSSSAGLGIPGGGVGIGQKTDDIFMFAWQGGFNYHLTTNVSATVAATLYNYSGLQQSSANAPTSVSPYFGDPFVGEGAYYYVGGPRPGSGYAPGYSGYSPGTTFNLPTGGYGSLSFPFNQVGLNHLLVLEVPFELDFKISKLDAQIFGDFAYNLEGAQRAQDAANAYSHILSTLAQGNQTVVATNFPAQTSDVKAYQIGFDLASEGGRGLVYGTTSQRHAWEVRTYWQHIEQYALDPNLLDTDFFEGRGNLQGVYVAVAYAFTGNLIGTFRYGHASRINDIIGTGGSGQDIPQINPINDFDIYQIDLTFKF